MADLNNMLRPESLLLRVADERDAPIVLDVELAAFGEYRGRLDPPSGVFAETVELVRAKMSAGVFVLALLDGAAIGSVFYQPEYVENFMYLGRLAVRPAFRNRGVGSALVAYVETRAAELGLACVRLGVRVVLPHLRASYERKGYRFAGEYAHEGYAEPTYVLLEKRV